jgi:hypothetical protein
MDRMSAIIPSRSAWSGAWVPGRAEQFEHERGVGIEAHRVRIGRWISILLLAATWAGCGTTKWTDTTRTATEQLLLTDSIDRAVSRLDFRALAGKKVFIDETPVKAVTDSAYLLSAIRQHLLASGGILKEKRDDADYIVEVRAGAIGTDRHDVLFGIPATQLPTMTMLVGAPSQIPEVPFVKKTDQRGVAKISLFAYNRRTGRPVWQSGAIPQDSRTKATWFFGAGPFQRGSIHEGMTFAGDRLHIPLIDPMLASERSQETVSVADQAYFVEPNEPPSKDPPKDAKAGVAQESGQGKDQAKDQAKDPAKDQAKDQAKTTPAAEKTPAVDKAVSPTAATVPIPETPRFSRVIPLPPTWESEPASGDVYVGDTWLGRRR